jgi:AraC-like DNA-binding protein
VTPLLLVDALARGGTLALLVLWSLILLRDHRDALAARLAVAMNLAIVCHVLVTIPQGMPQFPGERVFDMVSVNVPVLFWLFVRAWFNDEQRFGWLDWAGIPLTLVLVGFVYAYWPVGGPRLLAAAGLLRLSMFLFAVAGLWIAWRGRDGDLVEARRRLRIWLVWTIGLFVILTNAVEVAVSQGLLDAFWRSLVEIAITLLTFAICAVMFGSRQADLLAAPSRGKVTEAGPAPADEALAERLNAHFAAEKPWRDEGLTIAGLAARLGEQEYRLRRLINGQLGHRNFSQFLNGYRLAEVRQALADPAQHEVPILTIALDAGFGSLGPFNRAFREAEGMTPSEYRARALADSGIG